MNRKNVLFTKVEMTLIYSISNLELQLINQNYFKKIGPSEFGIQNSCCCLKKNTFCTAHDQ